jgi:hypothetical protein
MPMKTLWLHILPVALLTGTLIGCYPASPGQPPRKYVAHAAWGESILELHADGTFIEEATLKNGGKRRIEGMWEYRYENRVSNGPQ